MTAIPVVAAVVARAGRVLLCQRPRGKDLALKWEFPGGKIERGETPETALVRELMEELGVHAEILTLYDARMLWKDDANILLLFYRVRIEAGAPAPIECADLKWVSPEKLLSFDLADADREIARRIALKGLDD